MRSEQSLSSPFKWRRGSFAHLPSAILAAKLLLAMAVLWSAVTPAAEWMRLMPLGQWKQGPTVGSSGSVDALAVQVAGGYGYLADANYGLQVIDVSNPTNLQWTGGYATGGIAWNLTVGGALAYLADLDAGVVVVDVSNPTAPQRVGGYAVGAQGIALQGTNAYVACGSNGVHVLDMSVPTNPRRVGSCAVPGEASAIAVSGDYAYVLDFNGGRFVVISITNANAPQVVGMYQAGLNPTAVAVAGNEAYVAAGTSGLLIWDIRNPAAAKLLGKWADDCAVTSVAVSNSLAYLTVDVCYLDVAIPAVRVIDVENPASPVRVGGSDGIGARRVTRSGDYLFVADEYEGLRVIQLTELPAFTGLSVANGNLSLIWNRAASGFTLQRAGDLGAADWQDVPNSEVTNRMVLPLTDPKQMYRLRLQTAAEAQLPNRHMRPTPP